MAMMGAMMKRAILSHVRIQVSPPNALAVTRRSNLFSRLFSSHGDAHLTKDEVTDRILAVVKDFPKIDDPAKIFMETIPYDSSCEPTPNHFETKDVTPDVHFQRDLGLDSLDNVELVMAIEEEFKLEIPDLEADKIDSCKLAIEYVYNHPLSS